MPETPRVAVIGATGLVGDALRRAWERAGATLKPAARRGWPRGAIASLDIRDERRVAEFFEEGPLHWVALPAALPNVDYCETHPDVTRCVNVVGALHVARRAAAAAVPLVFFSSDYVFDGERQAYGESDDPRPLNEYGRQKLEAETGVLEASPRNLVLRTSGVYGWQAIPKNFALQVLAALGTGGSLRVAREVSYNPTAADNLAEVTVALAARGAGGVFHVVGGERVLRIDFAREVARAFALDEGRLIGVPSEELQSPTRRPRDSSLRTDKVRRAVPVALWGVREGLRRMRESRAEWEIHAARALPPELSQL